VPSSGGLDDLLMTSEKRDPGLDDLEFGANEALSGAEIDAISPQNLAASIYGVRVFYRVSPRHKLMIVRARELTFTKVLLFAFI
jgi:magnesium-transporting ATPase (P-type)